MTAEGVFPKINGDVLYASEVNYIRNSTYGSNSFASGIQLSLGTGWSWSATGSTYAATDENSSTYWVGSRIGESTTGSVVFILPNESYYNNIFYKILVDVATSQVHYLKIAVSGTNTTETVISTNSNTPPGSIYICERHNLNSVVGKINRICISHVLTQAGSVCMKIFELGVL